ncbi:MAG: hypothetical protein UY17_C0021G0004 [Candidatus Beckwithbacteria bacterium GW2011_GWC2_47_9]|uniref:Uncharacterized protein n=1 Tax=Candidatus Beckwithbacteria bacterium GW2011_GWC2_47_9 TaxID=1618373 RepID=A0A0G1WYM4_9BACT|nr:MAG: hypothetical protein UY17_C0021G0004 [Candidatus Beckwithbacteria bacterium GW2011_GWC2_47_9]
MPPEAHFALGHGCAGCRLTEVLHTGCPQIGHGHVVTEASAKERAANYQRILDEATGVRSLSSVSAELTT